MDNVLLSLSTNVCFLILLIIDLKMLIVKKNLKDKKIQKGFAIGFLIGGIIAYIVYAYGLVSYMISNGSFSWDKSYLHLGFACVFCAYGLLYKKKEKC